jgi:cell division protein ZapA
MPGVVTVDIGGQRYPIRSGLDPAYVMELAAYVDQKMRAASEAAPSTDMLSLAILVALNLADECFRVSQKPAALQGELHERTLRIEQLLDRALGTS